MATLSSFFGGGGGCCVDLNTNEWGTLLPTAHTVYTKCSVFSECLPTNCFTTCTNCCAKTLGVVPLKDNYFAVIGMQGSCNQTRSWAVRHYCISDSGNICRQSDWCRIHQSSSYCYLPLNAVSDGCGIVYFEYKANEGSTCYRLSTFCIDFDNCNICCICANRSYFARTESQGGGTRSCFSYSGKPGRLFALTKQSTCHAMFWWWEDGEACCRCECAQYGNYYDGRYLFAPTKTSYFFAVGTTSQCACAHITCFHTACSPQVYKTIFCCTVPFCCQGLLFSGDQKPFYVELDYCGASEPDKHTLGFLRMPHKYDSGLPNAPGQLDFGTINSNGHAHVVSDQYGATYCNRRDRRGQFQAYTGTELFCNQRTTTHVNGVMTKGGNFIQGDANFNYRHFYPNYFGGDETRTCVMSLGPMSHSLEASENMATFKAAGDRKIYPMIYDMPFNNRAGDDRCYNCFNGEFVVGKCWLLGIAICGTTGATGCAFYCFNVFKMSNYFA